MHPDLSSHLHSYECNLLIEKLKECHIQHSISKFWGACNEFDTAMNKCLKQERLERRRKNLEESRKRIARIKAKLAADNHQ